MKASEIRKRARNVISGHVYDMLVKVCDGLLEDAEMSKEFRGFTGNTQTSYSCGLYVNGRLSYYVSQDMWTKEPVRKKIPKPSNRPNITNFLQRRHRALSCVPLFRYNAQFGGSPRMHSS